MRASNFLRFPFPCKNHHLQLRLSFLNFAHILQSYGFSLIEIAFFNTLIGQANICLELSKTIKNCKIQQSFKNILKNK